MTKRTQQEEVDRNYEAFKQMLSGLMESDAGRFALLHNMEMVDCFDTNRDALQAGKKLLEDKPFSVQKITRKPVDLGMLLPCPHSRGSLAGKTG